VTCSTKIRLRKATTITDMYAALDLGQRTIRAVLKSQDGKIVNELKIKKRADSVLKFLNGTNASVVMESGYNYQYLYDLLKSEGYKVKVAHPLMVKAIAYAKVKTDKVDARILADLLRTDMIPECYIPDEKIRNLRDLARRRHYFVNTRTMFKNKVHVELSKRWIDYSTDNDNSSNSDLFTQKGREYLRSLKISGVKDCLDTIDFLDTKIQEMDNQIKILASNDKYAKALITIPGISYYAALLISSEIADINSGNENLRLSVPFFIIVMDSGSLWESCAGALSTAWLHIIRPTHLCLVYGREIVGPGSMTAHYCTKKENEMKK
jgi:transposase